MDEKPKFMDRRKLFLVSSSFLTAILNTVALLAIARNLDVTTLGALGFMLSFIGIIAFIGDMGYTHAFVRALDRGYSFRRCYGHYRASKLKMTFLLVIAGAIMIILWDTFLMGTDPMLAVYQGVHPVHPASLALILGFVTVTNMSQIWVTGRVAAGMKGVQGRFDLVEAAVRAFMVLGMIQLGITAGGQVDVFTLAFIYVTASSLGLIFMVFKGKKLRAKRGGDEVVLHFEEVSMKILPYTAFAAALLHADKLLLWHWQGLRGVGYYFGAQRIVIFIAASSGAITAIMGGALVKFKDDAEKIGRTFRMTERYITLMALPVTVFYIMFADDLLSQFLGSRFDVASESAVILAVSGLFVALGSPYMGYLVEKSRYRKLGSITGVSLGALVGLGVLLIPDVWLLPDLDIIHGMSGAALAVLASSLIAYAGCRWAVMAEVEFSSNPRILLHLLSAATMAFVLQFVIWYFGITVLWYWILIFALLGTLVYGVMTYLTGEFLRADFQEFKEAVSE